MPIVQAMCSSSLQEFQDMSAPLSLDKDCYLESSCQHIFRHLLVGFSGDFTLGQMNTIESCLKDSISSAETDGIMTKAEDEGKFFPDNGNLLHKLKRRQGRKSLSEDTAAFTLPPNTEFEANASIPGAPIDDWLLSQGQSMESDIDKLQSLSIKLWNLDRIDQRQLPLNGTYTYGSSIAPGLGSGVTIYTLDSGIYSEHQEFAPVPNDASVVAATGPQAPLGSRASCGWNVLDNNNDCTDNDGHGSHVAGSAIGLQTGVAKGAHVVSVKVLDSSGLGTVSGTVAGLDWIASNHKSPAVVTMSLGVPKGSYSASMETAVRELVLVHGVLVVAAAGNSGGDACQFSPASTPEAFTIAASDLDFKYSRAVGPHPESIYADTNLGSCVDLFAPGVDVWSVCGGTRRCGEVTPTTYAFASGTSMAVPHVAGVAALYLEAHPDASPLTVRAAITSMATQDAILPDLLTPGTPNILLMSRVDGGTEEGAGRAVQLVQAAQGPAVPSRSGCQG